jgi:cation transport regulator ChaB
MPWDTNEALVRSVPSLKALPDAAISMFRDVANRQLAKGTPEAQAMQTAWGVVKTKFKKMGNQWVAKSDAFIQTQYYTFEAQPAESFITRSDEGDELHNYVLTDLWPDNAGTAPSEELLQEWAAWINGAQPEADVDHELFNTMTRIHGGDVEMVTRAMRAKRGIAKAVKAVIDKGRLIVSLLFDKRYKNHIPHVKGLSIEAAAVRDTLTNTFTKGSLLGFTLAVNKNPINPRSVRV